MSSSKLPLVALLVVLLAVVAFLVIQGGDDATPIGSLPIAEDTGEPEPIDADEAVDANHPAQLREAVATRASVPAAGPAGLDPELRVEMAGFEGRVLHHDGKPAAEHRVILYRMDTNGIMGEINDLLGEETIDPDVDAGETVTDADGRFKLSGVWPRSLYLLYAGVGSDNPTPSIVDRTPRNREIVDLGDIYLRDGAIVTGTVVDEDDTPVAGALVRVVDLPPQIMQMVPLERFDPEGAIVVRERRSKLVIEMPPWVGRRFDQLPLPTTRSAADGSFRVTGIEPGNNNVVVATKRGLLAAILPGIQLRAGKEKDVGALTLDVGEEVYGTVKDSSGEPIAGAEVLLAQGGAVGEVHFAGPALRSAADGTFTAAGFKPGKVVGAARRRPGDAWEIAEAQSVMRDLELVLPVGSNLTVRLTSTAGRAIENPEFELIPGKNGDGAIVMKRFGFATPVKTEGRLGRLEDGRYQFTDLPAGDYTLLARAPGHAVGGQRIEMRGNTETTLQLDPENGLMVRVMKRSGEPVGAAMIYVEERGKRREQVGDMPLPAGRTNSDGRIAVGGMTRGTVRLSARHPRYGWVHADATIPGPELRLVYDEPGAIEGILTEKGQVPVAGKWTLVANREGERSRGAMPEMPKLTTADAQGAFSLPGMQPGEYRIQVLDSLKQYTTPGSFIQNMFTARMGMPNAEQQTYVVMAGQTTHITLDTEKGPAVVEGPAGRVSGTVMVNGMPATGMSVTGWGNNRVQADVDAGGRFDLGQVRVGQLYLQVIDPDTTDLISRGSLWSQSINVQENQTHTVEVNLQTGSLSGQVFAPDGTVAAGTRVRINGQIAAPGENGRGNANLNAISDEQGRFHFPQVPAGRFNIHAEHEQLGSGYVDFIEIGTGNHRADVRLQSTVTAAGRLDRSAFGEKVTHCWLTFRRESGNRDQRWEQIGEDGTFSVENLVPGSYRVTAWVNYEGSASAEWEHAAAIQVGPGGLEGLMLQMTRVKREEPGK